MPLTTYTAGEVLTAASLNANLSFAASSPAGGLTLIKTQTIGTTVSSVEVTGAFSSTYENYKIVVSGGVGSTGNNLLLQLGATTTGYYAGETGVVYSSAAANLESKNNGDSFRVGAFSTNNIGANFELFTPNVAKNTFIYGFRAVPSTSSVGMIYAGYLNDSTQYTAFTLITGGGTLTGGTIRVYGYANS